MQEGQKHQIYQEKDVSNVKFSLIKPSCGEDLNCSCLGPNTERDFIKTARQKQQQRKEVSKEKEEGRKQKEEQHEEIMGSFN